MNQWTSEPVNQWINEWMHQWFDDSVSQGLNESRNLWFCESVHEWINESMNQRISKPMSHWISDPVNQWMCELVSRWISESVNQWFNDSMNQRTKDSMNQLAGKLALGMDKSPMNLNWRRTFFEDCQKFFAEWTSRDHKFPSNEWFVSNQVNFMPNSPTRISTREVSNLVNWIPQESYSYCMLLYVSVVRTKMKSTKKPYVGLCMLIGFY